MPRSAWSHPPPPRIPARRAEILRPRFLPRRIHFHEIRQHARRPESPRLSVLDRAEQPLHRFGGIRPMRQNLFERVLASLLPREFRAQRVDLLSQLRRRGLARAPSLLPCDARSPPPIRAPSAAAPWLATALCSPSRAASIPPTPSLLLCRARAARARSPPDIHRSAPADSAAWTSRQAAAAPRCATSSIDFSAVPDAFCNCVARLILLEHASARAPVICPLQFADRNGQCVFALGCQRARAALPVPASRVSPGAMRSSMRADLA